MKTATFCKELAHDDDVCGGASGHDVGRGGASSHDVGRFGEDGDDDDDIF